MRKENFSHYSRLIMLFLAFGFLAGCATTVKVVEVKVVNMIPATLSAETNQDSEPFIAVDPTYSERVVATAFTPNPSGTASGLAPVYVSTDDGDTWTLRMIVPSAGALGGTGDITVATSGVVGRLYGGILRVPGFLLLNTLQTNDFVAGPPMTTLTNRTLVDQPFIQATTVGGNDRVYVGNNDFNAPGGRTATIDLSLDSGATFNSIRIEPRGTAGQDGPSIRPSIARDGTVYAAYFGWRAFSAGIATTDVVVVRDDNGGNVASPFQDLTDPSDGLSGRLVVQNVTIPWNLGFALGFERIGSSLSIAVDPNNSSTVYIAWADQIGTGYIYTIHVRRSTDRGVTWSDDLRAVTNATGFSLAVADNGTVGFLYQQFVGSGATSQWFIHLEQTRDGFASTHDNILTKFSGNSPIRLFGPYLGDYNCLLAVGEKFRGIFSASNLPDMDSFPNGITFQRFANFTTNTLLDGADNPVNISIDPYYFEVTAIE